jgi:Putative transposase/Transposase zinc-binding domain
VADVIRSNLESFLKRYRPSKEQFRVLNALAECQTPALGGHLLRCDNDRCGYQVVVCNSCRNRHCPKCQRAARATWLEAREREVLDVPYFHVVFTIPHELAPLALQNRRSLYTILFRAASETLLTLGRDQRHLGAELGCLALLHTWGQTLHLHPHLHCVIPGGGVSLDGERWVSCRDRFFLPIPILSRLFRGKFLAHLQHAFDHRDLSFHGRLRVLEHPKAWEGLFETLRNKNWVVYAKPPFGGPHQVLKYLARYTHRVAISNHRLLSLADGKVTFRYKDYAQQGRSREMTLHAVEFLRRFLLHVLPKGFMRIRYYGFLSNRDRSQKIQRVRALLGQPAPSTPTLTEPPGLPSLDSSDQPPSPQAVALCPVCKKGRLLLVAQVGIVVVVPVHYLLETASFDSS